jgi:hypothetical protein
VVTGLPDRRPIGGEIDQRRYVIRAGLRQSFLRLWIAVIGGEMLAASN